MKKLFLMALMAVVTVLQMQAQVVNTESVMGNREATKMRPDTVMPNGEWQKVVETTLTAKEGFKYGKQVLARIVPGFQQRVKLQDEEDAKIVVEVPLKLLKFFKLGQTEMSVTGSYTVTMTWLFKDGRYKVSAEDVKCTYQLKQSFHVIDQTRNEAFYSTNVKTSGALLLNLQDESSRLLLMFSKALEKQKADNDF
jgi:hypothetical protein